MIDTIIQRQKINVKFVKLQFLTQMTHCLHVLLDQTHMQRMQRHHKYMLVSPLSSQRWDLTHLSNLARPYSSFFQSE